jgi:hypothetical protein
VYDLRRDNHKQAIEPIDSSKELLEELYNSSNTVNLNSLNLFLRIKLHKRLNADHDMHIIWWDGKDKSGNRLDAEAFTISERVDDSKLDKYFTDLSAPHMTGGVESSKV